MNFEQHIENLRQELDAYYSTFDNAEGPLLTGLAAALDDHPDQSAYAQKGRMYDFLCTQCPIKLFRHLPFFFEISSGRPRFSWSGFQSPVGNFLHNRTADRWLTPYEQLLAPDRAEGYLNNWNNPVGFDHHCAGYDNLLRSGLAGIIAKAEEQLAACTDPKKQAFYRSVVAGNRGLISLAQRFTEEAARLAALAADAEEKAHYEKIAATAAFVPANPPRTFYEALCMILFYRECVGSVEGIGISTFSQLDRMLFPYYEADLAAGRITPEEAKQLLCDLLVYTDMRFDSANSYHETSTTIELGGCAPDGTVIYNELTEMILQSVIDVRSVGTKINCRISKNHPAAYLEKIAQVFLADLPCLMMHNDDVLIPARVKLGQQLEDARCYVGCGCHEVVLANTEVCTRADTWISLPRILLDSLVRHPGAVTFEDLYTGFLADAANYYQKIVRSKNEGERHWAKCAPLPLYSSSLTGPLETGKDATEGGARYNTTAISLVGAATLIDSLYTVKQLVFEEKKLTLPEFVQILDENYRGYEDLRQYIIRKIPKHGTNDATLNRFSAKVLEDLSHIAGQRNARGGAYLPAFYPHEQYRPLGALLGATPDGRLQGEPMSRGISPSEFIETESPLNVIHSLAPIDFTRYADSFVTEMTLPELPKTEAGHQILVAIIRAFLEAEGSSLQFNLLNRDTLLEAKKHPQRHKNLLVRVCGYSAAFVHLNEDTQNEIIRRAIR